ncbi:lasso peptide biosynthesis B2 protein [Spirulina sp. CCNP1310]|uniref:lasso peptide biosynthesis B2 protein n=1 Tax=Spirulina sp. CCNP1310 TaxID=3110249 RepID=UPI002B20D5EA|nr:lasso peptide biosynthesis B2 protein [Spirulina sp. CCNP1310]MEA5419811.1 lasso peptide biosynthesis B2 protein [Spirulina sp. CCNP1310]
MNWGSKGRSLRRLSSQDWRWFCLAYGLLPLIALLLQQRGLRRTQNLLTRYPLPKVERRIAVKRLAAMVMLADRYSRPWSNCLRRSLLLLYLLQRYGITASLKIGMRRHRGVMESHAWVEWEGKVLGDRADLVETYQTFQSPESRKN